MCKGCFAPLEVEELIESPWVVGRRGRLPLALTILSSCFFEGGLVLGEMKKDRGMRGGRLGGQREGTWRAERTAKGVCACAEQRGGGNTLSRGAKSIKIQGVLVGQVRDKKGPAVSGEGATIDLVSL